MMTGTIGRRRPRALSTAAIASVLLSVADAAAIVQQKLYGLPTGLAYYLQVNIGQPVSTTSSGATNSFHLLVDTGSSNTAVVTADCCSLSSSTLYSCAASSSCVAQATEVSVNYITGSWSGQLVLDTFSSSEIGVLPSVPFTEITKESNFLQTGYDGIVGLAFKSIGSPNDNVPTPYLELMNSANALPDVFSTLLCGSLQPLLDKDLSDTDDFYAGELLLGGTTGAKGQVYYEDELVYTPLVQAKWYNVLTTAVKVGDTPLEVDCQDINTPRTIIDSGTSNMAFPSAVYTAIVSELRTQVQKVIPGVGDAFFSDSIPCCSSYCDPSNRNASIFDLPPLTISLALDGATDQQISVTVPPEYIWRPLLLSTAFGIQKCRVFGISEGELTLLGDVFMDGLFTVHDRESMRLGLGVAKSCPNGATSSKTITVEPLASSICDCVSTNDRQGSLISSYLPISSQPCFFWLWWMYVVLASAALMLVSLGVVLYVCCQRRKYRRAAQRARLNRQHSNALGRNLLTPQCDDPSTPPTRAAPTTNRGLWAGVGANANTNMRPSNLTASTSSGSARQSEVRIEMRTRV